MASADRAGSVLEDDLDQCISEAIELDQQISGTSSDEYQNRVTSAIRRLEEITRQVSQLDIFSDNEHFDEISTSNARFLMLPALLASLNDKLTKVDRRTNLDYVEIYIKDFIKRLKSYGILQTSSSSNQFDIITADEEENKTRSEAKGHPSSSLNTADYLASAIRNREEKMKSYREQLQHKEKYEEMRGKFSGFKDSLNDDEFLREFFIVEMNYWARKLYELYVNIQREKPILEHMAKIESGEVKPELEVKRLPPPKPIILTRCKLQKEVFGLGYPGIPTMTVDEFYEEKKKEGQFPALSENKQGPITEEDERIEKERARERDDEEFIRSERDFDEYKDEHRRGWGNTHNIG